MTDAKRLNKFMITFTKVVDPYKVVEAELDNFSPYCYINYEAVKKHYPNLFKEVTELRGLGFNGDLCKFENRYLAELRL